MKSDVRVTFSVRTSMGAMPSLSADTPKAGEKGERRNMARRKWGGEGGM